MSEGRKLSVAGVLVLLTLCGSRALKRGGGPEHGSCQCVPDQWEGVLSTVERDFDMSDQKTDMMENSVRVHYDYTSGRFSMTDMSTGKRTVSDHRLGYKYIIGDRGCYQIRSEEEMRKMCLPAETQFLGRYTLGSSVPVETWQITTHSNLTTRTTVVQENCVPISEEIYMSKGAYASVASTVYLDITLGIRDESVFSVPSNCIRVEEEEEEETNHVHQKKRSYSFSEAIRSNGRI